MAMAAPPSHAGLMKTPGPSGYIVQFPGWFYASIGCTEDIKQRIYFKGGS